MEKEARVPEMVKIKKACEIMQALCIREEKIKLTEKHCLIYSSNILFKNFSIILKKNKRIKRK